MPKNILVAIGSARKGRVADSVTQQVVQEIDKRDDLTATVVDLAALQLPFFDNEYAPSAPAYVPNNAAVIKWGQLVSEADAVLFVTPEYNHTLSALQKNAIDSLFKEWENKPVVIVAYGWYGGEHSLTTLKVIAPVIKIDLKDTPAQLYFTKDIAPDGAVIDADSVRTKINVALDTI